MMVVMTTLLPLGNIFTEPPPWLLFLLWLSFGIVLFRTLAIGTLHSMVIRAWIMALLQHVPISLTRLVALRWHGYDVGKLVRGCAIAGAGGTAWSPTMAEAHMRAGGDPERAAIALVAAKQAGIGIDPAEVLAVELRGEDPLPWIEDMRREHESPSEPE